MNGMSRKVNVCGERQSQLCARKEHNFKVSTAPLF